MCIRFRAPLNTCEGIQGGGGGEGGAAEHQASGCRSDCRRRRHGCCSGCCSGWVFHAPQTQQSRSGIASSGLRSRSEGFTHAVVQRTAALLSTLFPQATTPAHTTSTRTQVSRASQPTLLPMFCSVITRFHNCIILIRQTMQSTNTAAYIKRLLNSQVSLLKYCKNSTFGFMSEEV